MSWRKLKIYIVRNVLLITSFLLLCASFFFYSEAEVIRSKYDLSSSEQFATGSVVTITGVIDGDEVGVVNETGGKGVVRLLGVKSFLSSNRDLSLGRFGMQSYDYLKTLEGKQMRLTLNKGVSVDAKGRLLGYLDTLAPKEDESLDIGMHMISQGWSVVYVEFPAERETVYLHAQQKADENKKGLWSNPGLANQVRGFNLLWRESRKEREQED